MEKNYYLHRSAKDAYASYLKAYASHQLKNIFEVNKLDLAKVGRSFGFSVPPNINLDVHSSKAGRVERRGGGGGYGGGYGGGKPDHIAKSKAFRAKSSDGRQFSR